MTSMTTHTHRSSAARRFITTASALIAAAATTALLTATPTTALGAAAQPQPTTTPANTENVQFSPTWTVGSNFTYTINYQAILTYPTSDEPDAEEEPNRTIRQRTTLRVNVIAIDPETKISTLTIVPTAMTVSETVLDESRSASFTTGRFPGTVPAPDDVLTPRPGQELPTHALAAVTRALAESVIRIDVAPDGQIIAISGLENANTEADNHPFRRDGERAMGYFAPAVVARNLEQLWRIDTADENGNLPQRKRGDSWKVSHQYALPTGGITHTQNFNLIQIRQQSAELSGTITTEIIKPQGDPDPALPTVEVQREAVVFTTAWSLSPGIIRERAERGLIVTIARLEAQDAEPVIARVKLSTTIDATLEAMQLGR